MEATRIYLVRHAHANWQPDDARPLSPSGLLAAQVVAERLSPQPIIAIYSSPSLRSIQTVTPLADRLGLHPQLLPELRERELPKVPTGEFNGLVLDAWRCPDKALRGGESNVDARARGIRVVRSLVTRHVGGHVVVATHGNLVALMLNGLDSAFGYEFWRRLSFPDVYRLTFDADALIGVEHMWEQTA